MNSYCVKCWPQSGPVVIMLLIALKMLTDTMKHMQIVTAVIMQSQTGFDTLCSRKECFLTTVWNFWRHM